MYELMMASASPRRRELIESLGRPVICMATDADETMNPELSPADAVTAIAARKAQAAVGLPESSGRLIIAADTIVVADGVIFGKPKDEADASRMLHELSGREHEVLTGMCLISPKGLSLSFCESTLVEFCPLTEQEIDAYIASGDPMDKAGAYAIQGAFGAKCIKGIKGSYHNVVGLPVSRLYHEIIRLEELERRI